jgi:hypothetical protein
MKAPTIVANIYGTIDSLGDIKEEMDLIPFHFH